MNTKITFHDFLSKSVEPGRLTSLSDDSLIQLHQTCLQRDTIGNNLAKSNAMKYLPFVIDEIKKRQNENLVKGKTHIMNMGEIDENDFVKSEEIDLEKAGEGSRGGKIIGHTTSGKPIYGKCIHPSHSNFTAKDHEEAAALHADLGEGGDNPPEEGSPEHEFHVKQYFRHSSQADRLREKEKNNFVKSESGKPTLEKAGEGSRGGKVIGHTSSGKPIYDTANHPSHANFTKQDHWDARAAHFLRRDSNTTVPSAEEKIHSQKAQELSSKETPHSKRVQSALSVLPKDEVERHKQMIRDGKDHKEVKESMFHSLNDYDRNNQLGNSGDDLGRHANSLHKHLSEEIDNEKNGKDTSKKEETPSHKKVLNRN